MRESHGENDSVLRNTHMCTHKETLCRQQHHKEQTSLTVMQKIKGIEYVCTVSKTHPNVARVTTFLFLLLSVCTFNISRAAEFTSECKILVEVKNTLLFDG